MPAEQAEERFARLADLVGAQRGSGRWLILTHDNPDPDAIASAALLARILRRGFRRKVTVAYGGIIGRAENREMVKRLRLRLSHVRHLSWKHYKHFALVDCQPQTGNNQLPEKITADMVFDHHPIRRASREVGLADIRPEYGATATIIAEYMLAGEIDFGKREATAVVYAIRAETQDFRRESTGPDKRIFDHFFPESDKRALAAIQSPRLPLSYYRTLDQALGGLRTVDTVIFSHLGDVDQPDIVPEVADLLVRMEGKTWALTTGRFEDRLYLSIRTTNSRARAGRLMRRLVARKGKGGGHGMTGGGWVNLSEDEEEAERLERSLTERLARALRKDPEKIAPISLDPEENDADETDADSEEE